MRELFMACEGASAQGRHRRQQPGIAPMMNGKSGTAENESQTGQNENSDSEIMAPRKALDHWQEVLLLKRIEELLDGNFLIRLAVFSENK
jgi:hypothetical protein